MAGFLRKAFVAVFTLFAAHMLMAQIVFAMGGSSGQSEDAAAPPSPEFTAGKEAIDKSDWQTAIDAFTKAVAREPKNADAYNYLGFANRKLKNYDAAFTNYEKALSLNPEHRGAHEYIGEAYLQTNNLPKAEEHLAALDKLCFFGCPEYTMLKRAVEDYKAGHS